LADSDDQKDLKKAISELLSANEAFKAQIQPLIRDDKETQDALALHEKTISVLMEELLGTKADHKRMADNLEMVSAKCDTFQEKLELHESLHGAVEKRLARIENLQVQEINKLLRESRTPSKAQLKALDEFIKIHPDDTRLLALKAKVLDSMGDIKNAVKWIDDSIAKYPSEAYLWYTKGLLLDVSNSEEELKCYNKSLELVGEDKVLRHLVAYLKSSTLARLGRLDEALTSVEEAIKNGPKCSGSWAIKGMILKDLNKIPESMGCFAKSLELDQNDWYALLGYGLVLAILGRNEEALAYFDKAAHCKPDSSLPYFGKTDVLMHMNLPPKALDSIEEGLTRDPKNACAWCKKGFVLLKLEQNDKALESFEKSIQLNPPDSCMEVLLHKGLVLVEEGRIPEARDWLRSLDEKKIHSANALNSYSYALFRLGEFEKGIETARRALEMNADVPHYWDTLACNLTGAKSDSDAIVAFRKAASLATTDDAISWNVYNSLCDRMGLGKEAEFAREKVGRP
jgi:tetratricopeptide (TPR) repeat protein